MPGETVLKLDGVSLCYKNLSGRKVTALDDVSFSLNRGEILGVIGRNGSGKSTLLRLLAGIYQQDKGVIEKYSNSASLLSLKLGFIPHLSGRENAILSSMLHGFSRSKAINNLPEVVRFGELEEYIDNPLKTYSSGMVARLGFSVAYHIDPDILLVDEVLGVGDMEFRERSRTAILKKMHAGKTVVLVSHQLNTIKKLCQRVVWLERGKVKLIGEPDEVLRCYRRSKKPVRN